MNGTLVSGLAVNGNGNIIGSGTECVICDNLAQYDYAPLLSFASSIIIRLGRLCLETGLSALFYVLNLSCLPPYPI